MNLQTNYLRGNLVFDILFGLAQFVTFLRANAADAILLSQLKQMSETRIAVVKLSPTVVVYALVRTSDI